MHRLPPQAKSALDFPSPILYIGHVHQIIFNEISAAEISRIPTLEQLELFAEFQVTEEILNNKADARYGCVERAGEKIYRFRTQDYRLYFQIEDGNIIVHRVLHKNTLKDFLYRSNLSSEDQELGESRHFWKLIEEGENAKRQN